MKYEINEHNFKNIDAFKRLVGERIHDAVKLTQKDSILMDANLTFKIQVSNGTVTGFTTGEITHHLQMEN